MSVLVELYAGMAAVSARACGSAPVCSYKGGKRRLAYHVLDLLGAGEPEKVVLNEADPYVADALLGLWVPGNRPWIADRLREWGTDGYEGQRERWCRFAHEAHADGWDGLSRIERAARV